MMRDELINCFTRFHIPLNYLLLKIQNSTLVGICALMWPIKYKAIETICIHRVGKIGDIVCALPALFKIHQRWPQSRIIVFTSSGQLKNSPLVDLSKGLPWIDVIEIYDSLSVKDLKKILRLIRKLRGYKIDLWVALPQDLTNFSIELRNMLFARIVGASYGFGFRVNTSKLFSSLQIRHSNFKRETETLLDIVDPLRADEKTHQYGFDLNLIISTPAYIKFSFDDRKIMAIAPGANRRANRWPLDRFVSIALRWIQTGGVILIIGGSQDIELGEEIKKSLNSSSLLNLCGKTNLVETIYLLSKVKILVTNDSGPMHLAAVAKTPVVAIFSARDFPLKWSPHPNWSKVLRVNTDCSPCFKDDCDRDNLCLSMVAVDDVWHSVKNVLKT